MTIIQIRDMSSLQSINIASASDNTSSGFFEIENCPVLKTVTIQSGSLQNYDSINLTTVPKLIAIVLGSDSTI